MLLNLSSQAHLLMMLTYQWFWWGQHIATTFARRESQGTHWKHAAAGLKKILDLV